MSPLNRKSVERIFIFFLFYLPIQYLLVGVGGLFSSEPWPTFALPGFKNVYSTEQEQQIVRAFFYVHSSSDPHKRFEVAPDVLFAGIQPSQLQGFLRRHFDRPKTYSRESRTWLTQRLERLYPEDDLSALEVVWRKIIYTHENKEVVEKRIEDLRVVTIPLVQNDKGT